MLITKSHAIASVMYYSPVLKHVCLHRFTVSPTLFHLSLCCASTKQGVWQ